MASDSGSTTILNVSRAPSHELPGVNGAGSYIALIIGILTQVDPRRNIGNSLECHIDPPGNRSHIPTFSICKIIDSEVFWEGRSDMDGYGTVPLKRNHPLTFL